MTLRIRLVRWRKLDHLHHQHIAKVVDLDPVDHGMGEQGEAIKEIQDLIEDGWSVTGAEVIE